MNAWLPPGWATSVVGPDDSAALVVSDGERVYMRPLVLEAGWMRWKWLELCAAAWGAR